MGGNDGINFGASGKIIDFMKRNGFSRISDAEKVPYSEYWVESEYLTRKHEIDLNLNALQRAETENKKHG